jgi:hypothetical protein
MPEIEQLEMAIAESRFSFFLCRLVAEGED